MTTLTEDQYTVEGFMNPNLSVLCCLEWHPNHDIEGYRDRATWQDYTVIIVEKMDDGAKRVVSDPRRIKNRVVLKNTIKSDSSKFLFVREDGFVEYLDEDAVRDFYSL